MCHLSYSQVWNDGKWYYRSEDGNGDGYTETAPTFKIKDIKYEELICEGTPAVMSVQPVGTEMFYNYAWFEVGKENVILSDKSYYEIPACTVAEHNGKRYRCRVSGLWSNIELVSGDVILKVIPKPLIQITSPSAPVILCAGETVTLVASCSGSGYAFSWTGNGVPFTNNSLRITATPEDSTVYTVYASDRGCVGSAQSVPVRVVKQSIRIPEEISVMKGDNVEFAPLKSVGATLNWIVDGRSVPAQDNVQFIAEKNVKVTVESVIDKCRVTDECSVNVGNIAIRYTGGEEDGYVESDANFIIKSVTWDDVICDGSSVLMSVQTGGSEIFYSYEWYEEGKESTVLSTERFYKIPVCKYAEHNSRKYRCRVYGLWSRKEKVSDVVTLNVVRLPEISITSLSSGVTLCAGEPINLVASSVGSGYTFSWTGDGIPDNSNGLRVIAKPGDSTIYTVYANDRGCVGSAQSAPVHVVKQSVQLPGAISVIKGDMVEFAPLKSHGAVLNWTVDGRSFPAQDKLSFVAEKDVEVIVESVIGTCKTTAACAVSTANMTIRYTGGDDDGFIESDAAFAIRSVNYDTVVCEGAPLVMSVQTTGTEVLYTYAWYEVGKEETVLSTKRFYEIPACTSGYNGREYQCKVFGAWSKKELKSKIVKVKVQSYPTVQINSPADNISVCKGSDLRLEASGSDDKALYAWTGSGIPAVTNAASIIVKPEKTGNYVVTVNRYGCVGTASVRVNVTRNELSLREEIFADAGEEVVLVPVKEQGAVLNWQVGGVSYPSGDSLRLTVNDETRVKVQAVTGGCSVEKECVIHVSTVAERFVGGDNDGFVESKQGIDVSGISYKPQVCEGDKADFKLDIASSGIYTFEWRKEGVDQVLSTEQMYSIGVCKLEDSGLYYCICTNVDTRQVITTEKMDFEVVKVPSARIESPLGDTVICYGDRLALSAAAIESDENYNWTGENILGSSTLKDIEVSPNTTSEYQLFVSRKVCWRSDKLNVQVERPSFRIPEIISAVKDEAVVIVPEKESGNVKFKWFVDGNVYNEEDVFRYKPVNAVTKIYGEKRIGKCVVRDSAYIYLRDVIPGSGDYDDDGYVESDFDFYILGINHTPLVCLKSEATFTVNVKGYDVYSFAWKKDGDNKIYSTEQTFSIPEAELIHAGKYYCEVTELKTQRMKKSELVELQVITPPALEILAPAEGTELCQGESVEIKVTDNSEWTYMWDGPELGGELNRSSIVVKPLETSVYSVIARSGDCVTERSIEIGIKKLRLNVSRVIETTPDVETVINPSVPAGALLDWRWDANSYAGTVLNTYFAKSTVVRVKMEHQGCSAEDSVYVYVKDNGIYLGGEEDGFDETEREFLILGMEAPEIICEDGDAELLIRVQGSGLYKYEWRKTGEDRILSREPNLLLKKFPLRESGSSYYCRVVDLFSGDTLTSDAKVLQVKKMPLPVIGRPAHGTWICVGEKIRLDARETEDTKESPEDIYNYIWAGENITPTERPYIVDVQPGSSQVYEIGVEFHGCMVYDTITINVSAPKVTVPPAVYLNEGESAVIKAEISDIHGSAVINWWNELRYYPNQPSFELKDVRYSTVVIAEVVAGNCKGVDSTMVFLKLNNFAGGEDDGFMESCDVPMIIDDKNNVLGCGGEDSVLLEVKTLGEVDKLVWEKYNEVSGEFEALQPAANLKGLGTSKLVINPVGKDDLGDYHCRLENGCGYVFTKPYTVTDGTRPRLAVEKIKTIEYCEGAKNVSISIPVINKEGVSYRWFKRNEVTGKAVQFTPERLYNSEYFTFVEIQRSQDGMYIAEAKNQCGSTRDTTILNVINGLRIAQYVRDTAVCKGGEIRLWINTTGGTSRSYKLVKYIKDITVPGGYREEKVCSESDYNEYTIASAATEDAGYYRWLITSDCGGEVKSELFYLTVENPVVFVQVSRDTAVCEGGKVQLTALAQSPGVPSSYIYYSWEKDGIPVSGTTFRKTISPVNGQTAGAYVCRAHNSCPVQVSPQMKVSLGEKLNITVQPSLGIPSYCEGTAVSMEFSVDFPVLADSIQWYKNTLNGSTPVRNQAERISGSNRYILTIDSLLPADAGVYVAKVFSGCGTVTTEGVELKVDEKARFKKGIGDNELKFVVCEGEQQKLTVNAVGQNLQFMWLCNGVKISDETSNSIVISFDSTATYCCHVQNQCGGEYSCADISVIRADTFRLTGGGTYCAGEDGRELVLAGSDTNYVYRLYEAGKSGINYLRELSGKDAGRVGGELNFGRFKKGTYHVIAKSIISLCEFTMPGEVKIIENALPRKFAFGISRELCPGIYTAALQLAGSENNNVQYKLFSYNNSVSDWDSVGMRLGTKDTLVWEGITKGQYRVKALNTQTGCSVFMDQMPEVKSRPVPAACDILALNNDSTYCQGSDSDVTLHLEEGCPEANTYYVLKRNGLPVRYQQSGTSIRWPNVEEGHCKAEATNQWGCKSETKEIAVVVYGLPSRYVVSGGGYYCDTETEGNKVVVLENSDKGIQYDFMKLPGEKIYSSLGAGKELLVQVPLEEADYYVLATDTVSGCSVEMSNRVNVKESRLALSSLPVSVDFGSRAQLNLTIRNAIGTPEIRWSPADAVSKQGIVNPLTIPILSSTQTVYEATVSDSACTKKHTIQVILKGDVLSAYIKDADCNQPAGDTISVCKGTSYALCGGISGGVGNYLYTWEQDGTVLGTDVRLSATAGEPGYVFFGVNSGELKARDSVWLNVLNAPEAKEILLPKTACYGSTLSMGVKNSQSGVRYELYRKVNNENRFLAEALGNGSDLVIKTVIDPGEYRIVALDTQTLCSVALKSYYTISKQPRVFSIIAQDTAYCASPDNGARLGISGTETGMTYYLQRYNGREFTDIENVYMSGNGVEGARYFDGRYAAGQYRIRAHNCGDVIMDGVIDVKEIAYPGKSLQVEVAGNSCTDSTFSIVLNPTQSDVLYKLYLDGNETAMPVITGTGLPENWEIISSGSGKYTVRADRGGCTVWLDKSVTVDSFPAAGQLEGTHDLCQNMRTELYIRNYDSEATYKLYDDQDRFVTGGVKEGGKIIFRNVMIGHYYAVAFRGNCQGSTSVHDIDPLGEPNVDLELSISGGTPLCAGGSYEITVENSEADVRYILVYNGQHIDTISGGIGEAFRPVSKDGNYQVLPKSQGMCGSTYIDTTFVIHKLPKKVVATPCRYCDAANGTADEGCSVLLQNVSERVSYILQAGNVALDTVKGTLDGNVAFAPVKIGNYTVLAIDETTGCSDIAANVSVSKGTKPEQLPVGVDGARCGKSVIVSTIGSEGDSVEYYLYRNLQQVGGPLTDNTGSDISFGEQDIPGVYKVYAYKPASGCGTFMIDSIIVTPELVKDTLKTTGRYCENEVPALRIAVEHSTKQWQYYLVKDTGYSDTLRGTGGKLSWNKVGGQIISAGSYVLNAFNECGEEIVMDTLEVVPNKMPVPVAIEGGDSRICPGAKREIRLENSFIGVNYTISLAGSPAISRTLPGNGAILSFGEYASAGKYIVTAADAVTGCRDTMDMITLTSAQLPVNPGIKGEDVCLDVVAGNGLTLELVRRQAGVSYYLQKNGGGYVDSIPALDDEKIQFTPQYAAGSYDIVAIGVCSTRFEGYKIGSKPTVQKLGSIGLDTVCKGTPVNIWLEKSQANTDYLIYRTTDDIDADTAFVQIKKAGNNGRLDIGTVNMSGIYLVKAFNGCESWMNGTLNLTVEAPYEVLLRKEGYTICDGDAGVKIEILGITNPDPDATYDLYRPGETVPAESIRTGDQGASIVSSGVYNQPGFYVVKGNYGKCPTQDSVEIKVRPLPAVFELNGKGNGYLCSGETEEIVLSNSQAGVDYTLYKRVGADLVSKDVRSGGHGAITFTARDTGVYIVKGKYTGILPACEQVMAGEITIVGSTSMKSVKLESVRNVYCYSVTHDTLKGKVMVNGSEAQVEYQLLKDGVPYGNPVEGEAGKALVWDKLPGGVPKDIRFPELKVGIDYTLQARNMVTGCVQSMAGKVNIVEEREVQFRDDLLKGQTPCVGDPVLLDFQSYGGNLIFTWLKKGRDAADWVKVQEGSNSFYGISAVTENDYGYYKCAIANTCGADTTVTVEVNPQLLIVKEGGMADRTICSPEPGKLTDVRLATVIKNATAYSWTKDGVAVAGGNKLWLDIKVGKASGTGMYICTASNRCGTLTDTCIVTVDDVPSFTIPSLLNDTLCRGDNFVLSVESSDNIQWYRGNDKLNKTGNRLEITGITPADEGIYFAEVSTGCGTQKKQAGRLWVDDTIQLISVSESRTLCETAPLSLSIITNQDLTGRVEYRWHDGEGNLLHTGPVYSGIDLTKTEGNTLKYTVTYSNACSYKFNDIRIKVDRAVEYDRNTPARELLLCAEANRDTVLRIVHSDDLSVDYQWFFHPQGGIPRMIGENADSLVIPLSIYSTGAYYCSLTNSCADSTTRTSWVRIDSVPVIGGHLQDTMVCPNSELMVELPYVGGNATCLWVKEFATGRLDTIRQNLSGNIAGTVKLRIPSVDVSYDSCFVWCRINNSCGEDRSDTMLIRVRPQKELIVTPDTVRLCGGEKGEVLISVKNGDVPWGYSYTLNGKNEQHVVDITSPVDTLEVTAEGIYEITGLSGISDRCPVLDEDRYFRVMNNSNLAFSFTGGGEYCENERIEFNLSVTGGVGPWEINIVKKSGGLATELSETYPLIMYGRDTVLMTTALNSDEYYIYKSIVDKGSGCAGLAPEEPLTVTVHKVGHIDFGSNWPARIGQCQDVNLRQMLNPTLDGAPVDRGVFYLNKKTLNGDQWLKQDMRAGCYNIVCKYTDVSKCVVTSDEVRICVDTLPYGRIIVPEYSCEGVADTMRIWLYPGVQDYTVKYYQHRYQHNPGGVRTDLLTVNVPASSGGVYSEVLGWSILAPADSCLRYEIVSITDGHGCVMAEPSGAVRNRTLRDTVFLHQFTQLKIQTKVSEKSPWIETSYPIDIAPGDSVGVRAILETGTPPWTLTTSLTTWDWIEHIPGRDTVFWLRDEGVYDFKAQDDYCRLSGNTKEVEINWLETGYLRGKLFLEGPYDPGIGEMNSNISDKLLKEYGLSRWPNTPDGTSVIDYVSVELRSAKSAAFAADLGEGARVVTQDTCLLLSNGQLADRYTGDTLVAFKHVVSKEGSNNYYVIVRHRNHIGVMSAKPVHFAKTAAGVQNINFTNSANVYSRDKKYENHMSLYSSIWLLSAGELNENSLISIFDPNRITIDDTGDVASGKYDLLHDVNFDGRVDWPSWNGSKEEVDWSKVRRNRGKFSEVK